MHPLNFAHQAGISCQYYHRCMPESIGAFLNRGFSLPVRSASPAKDTKHLAYPGRLDAQRLAIYTLGTRIIMISITHAL